MTTDLAVAPTPVLAPPALAGWWRRVAATLLDDALLGGVVWLAVGAGAGVPSLQPTFGLASTDDQARSPWSSGWVMATLAVLVLLLAYTGATPGKRVAGIAVVRADTGEPAGLLRSLARPVVHLLDAVLMIGYLRPLWHPLSQTFADSALGTVVVQTRNPRPHPWFARLRRPAGAAGRTAVTLAAVGVCALGVGFGVTTSSSGSTRYVGGPAVCDVQPEPAGNAGAGAALTRVQHTSVERRLWVVRDTGASGTGLEVAWSWWGMASPETAQVVVRVAGSDAAGSGVTRLDGPEQAFPGEQGSIAQDVDPELLTGIGDGGRLESDLLLDGRVVASCAVDAPLS